MIDLLPSLIKILFSVYPIRRPAPAAKTIQLTLLMLTSIYTGKNHTPSTRL